MKPEVSILVTVWNTERFVERCLASALEQTLREVEVVVVDDCSPDRSMEIVRETAAHYPGRSVRIVEHSRNLGSAAARNTALRQAQGNYVIFLDSDDWVDAGMCERLLEAACISDADIVVCDFWLSRPDRETRSVQRALEDPAACIGSILNGRLHGSCCNKLIRKSIYTDNGITFPEGLNIWEDLYASVRLFACANRVAYLPEAFLHYVQYNPVSYMSTAVAEPLTAERQAAITRLVEETLAAKGLLPRLETQLVSLKLRSKRPLALSPDREANRRWAEIFPEVNRKALGDKTEKPLYRLCVWLVWKRMFWTKDAIAGTLRALRRMLGA